MLKHFFQGIREGMIESYRGRNLFWHFSIILLTYLLVMSGFDWWFFSVTRGTDSDILGILSGIIGFFVPILIPLCMYVISVVRRDTKLKHVAVYAFRAVVVSFLIIAIYKAFTGRIEPEFLAKVAVNDNSRDFNFGFLRHGIFWGWPSSHAGVAFALSVFLGLWYRIKPWVGAVALLYSTFIAIGAAVSFHWFSDVLSGIIIGSLIGYIVYKERRFLEKENKV